MSFLRISPLGLNTLNIFGATAFELSNASQNSASQAKISRLLIFAKIFLFNCELDIIYIAVFSLGSDDICLALHPNEG